MEHAGFGGHESYEWGAFMVYMPMVNAVLLPRTNEQVTEDAKESARIAIYQTINNVIQNIGTVSGGQVTGVSASVSGGK